MIQLSDARDQAAVLAALRSENPAAETSWEFWTGNELLDNRVESLSYGREGDSQAMVLESDVSGPLDPAMKGQDATVDVIVAGIPVRRFTGSAHRPVNAGFRGRLLANTAGWWARGDNAVKLGRVRRFDGYSPKRTAEEQLFRLPYSGGVDVQDTSQATFLRGATEPFEKTEEVGAVLDAVTEETRLIFTDTRLNGVAGRIPEPVALNRGTVWTFRSERDFGEGNFSYSPEPREYRDVLAYRVLSGTGSTGETEDLAYAEIPGSEAPEGATYQIPVETEGPEAYAEAAAKVNDAVTMLVNGEQTGTLTIPFVHVLLEEGDVVEVLEAVDAPLYSVPGLTAYALRRWRCRLDLIRDDPSELSQTFEWTGVYQEEVVEVAEAYDFAPGGSVVMPPLGRDYLARFYFEDSLPFVSHDPGANTLTLDEDAALTAGVSIDITEDGMLVVSD